VELWSKHANECKQWARISFMSLTANESGKPKEACYSRDPSYCVSTIHSEASKAHISTVQKCMQAALFSSTDGHSRP
jgi:hypothetical protein